MSSYSIVSANVAIGESNVHTFRSMEDGTLKVGRDDFSVADHIDFLGNITAYNANVGALEVQTFQTNALDLDSLYATTGNISTLDSSLIRLNNVDILDRVKGYLESDTRLYVSSTRGSDTYDGSSWVKAFRTIKAAVDASVAGTTIFVETGTYLEDNPITVPANVSIIGDNLRRVLCYAQNPHCDFLHLNNMCYVTGLRFIDLQKPAYACAFPCATADVSTLSGTSIGAVTLRYSPSGYTEAPPVYVEYPETIGGNVAVMHAVLDGNGKISSIVIDSPGSGYLEKPHISIPPPTSQKAFITASPYVQNCSSITGPFTISGEKIPVTRALPYDTSDVDPEGAGGGIRIDGYVCHPLSPLRSFVADAFTQVNQGGPGFFIVNRGYAQFVSCFTTFCSFSYKASSGGSTNISNSVTDFGTYGLVAKGYDRNEYTRGNVVTTERTTVASFQITNEGSGYTSVPTVTITGGGATVDATAVATLLNGKIDAITLTSGGVGYDSIPTVTLSGGGPTENAEAVAVLAGLSDIRFDGLSGRRPDIGSVFYYGGQWRTITGVAFVSLGTYDITSYPPPAYANAGDSVPFYVPSIVSTGGHVFEFAGGIGTSAVTYNALPEYGGIPNPANEVYNILPGRVFFTASDPLGRFRVGEFFAVEQATGEVTINSDRFNLAGLNRIGPFRRNGVAVGVQIEECSNNPYLISSTGQADGTTVPTQAAVKTYVDERVPPNTGNIDTVLTKRTGDPWDMQWRLLTKTDVGLANVADVLQIPMSEKGVANGVATLDSFSKIPSAQMSSNVNTMQIANIFSTTVTLTAATANRALVTNANNVLTTSAATDTEVGYLSGVTSGLQTQLNGKAATAHVHDAANITSGTLVVARGGTGVTTSTGSGSVVLNTAPTISSLTLSGVTSNRALVTNASNVLTSSTVTGTEVGYLSGVTSGLQTQLNGKAATAHTHDAANITSGTLVVARGGTGVTTSTGSGSVVLSTAPTISSLTLSDVTGNRALVTNASSAVTQSAVTATELGYLSGVTSGIQAQLNALSTGGGGYVINESGFSYAGPYSSTNYVNLLQNPPTLAPGAYMMHFQTCLSVQWASTPPDWTYSFLTPSLNNGTAILSSIRITFIQSTTMGPTSPQTTFASLNFNTGMSGMYTYGNTYFGPFSNGTLYHTFSALVIVSSAGTFTPAINTGNASRNLSAFYVVKGTTLTSGTGDTYLSYIKLS